jgi:2-succinyl-6-hydroxy-2,4-cyclohexadiene-1-carboxylate synthase
MATRLETEVRGRGPRLALVHGFTQNRRCWGPFVDLLEPHFELVLVDAPGHGGSSAIAADVAEGAALIGDAVGPGSYLGYSMGGRHALRLALDRPDLVERLVLIGAAPGLADAGEREQRRAADDALASHLEQVGVATFVDEWLAQPIFADVPTDARFATERRCNTTTGLASSLRLAGTGTQEPLWDRLGELRAPTLLIVGAADRKFRDLATRMEQRIGSAAELVVIPHAGHAPQLVEPVATAAVVTDWMRTTS